MIWPFKCKHPFNSLMVRKPETSKAVGDDFIEVTYYLVCHKCGEKMERHFYRFNGGPEAFLSRGRKDNNA